MNKVILFRGWKAASKFPVTRTHPAKPAVSRVDHGPIVTRRPALIATWHANPFTGKLECLWVREARAVLDDDGNCDAGAQRAA